MRFDWRALIHPDDLDRMAAEEAASVANGGDFILGGALSAGERRIPMDPLGLPAAVHAGRPSSPAGIGVGYRRHLRRQARPGRPDADQRPRPSGAGRPLRTRRSRGRAAARPETGGRGPAHRRGGARLQQSADGHHRRDGPDAAPPNRRRPARADDRGGARRGPAWRAPGLAQAPGLLAPRPGALEAGDGQRRRAVDRANPCCAARCARRCCRPSTTGSDGAITSIDPSQFEAAVVNTVVSARDATPQGGGIRVETHPCVLKAGGGRGRSGERLPLCRRAPALAGMDAETAAQVFDRSFTTKEPGAAQPGPQPGLRLRPAKRRRGHR